MVCEREMGEPRRTEACQVSRSDASSSRSLLLRARLEAESADAAGPSSLAEEEAEREVSRRTTLYGCGRSYEGEPAEPEGSESDELAECWPARRMRAMGDADDRSTLGRRMDRNSSRASALNLRPPRHVSTRLGAMNWPVLPRRLEAERAGCAVVRRRGLERLLAVVCGELDAGKGL